MWPYWVMFLLPAAAALMQPTRPWALAMPQQPLKIGATWAALAATWALVIGLRHQVGGDWYAYVQQLVDAAQEPASVLLTRPEPGYWLVTWLVSDHGGIYAANLVFGFMFSIGLVVFCRAQPRPWLALAIAVPYLVVVVAMGYTRQGVALGFSMIGLVALQRKNTFGFVLWVAAGALFHRTAVVLIPLGILATPRNKLWTSIWLTAAGLAFYELLLGASVEDLRVGYLEAEYESAGAWVRVLMNVFAAGILFLGYRRFLWEDAERRLWTTLALLSFAAVGWLVVSPSSTAVDRLALYLIPVQLYVFTRLPDLMASAPSEKRVWVGLILAYYASVQFVWLVYANNAEYWLPYRFYPLESM